MDFFDRIKKESKLYSGIDSVKSWFIRDDDLQPEEWRKEKTRKNQFGVYKWNRKSTELEKGFKDEWSIGSDIWF